jgi:hypothetical protein
MRENGDSSDIQEDLQPYVDAGIVDFGLMEGPKHPTQTNWYNECSKLAQPTHSWVGFIDLDEFIVVLHRCALRSLPEHGMVLAHPDRSGSDQVCGATGVRAPTQVCRRHETGAGLMA